ncbi:response regulator transcription factor [Alkalibacterium sp. 20]|uniref:response regulator n=1 Tax=Alkalibacterium sp. 20 TaxID=1798803 RepID=UPI0009202193|nr:response regulator transcription factor [Alkalibacterium sp. 20]OJF94619.1 hypothetical protein AX762_01770 [Alkalibacterium sp. 20]
MMNKIKVVIIDDHNIVRMGIKSLIEKDDRFYVSGESDTLTEGLSIILSQKPDVVLLDFRLPDGDAVIGTKRIKTACPDVKVLILTAYQSEEVLSEVLRVGADGFLLKTIESVKITEALYKVYKGEGYLDESISGLIFDKLKSTYKKTSLNPFSLTLREKNILDLLVNGNSNKEIAYDLEIAEKTVRNNLTRIMEKLNVTNRTEAALVWKRYIN